jgi:GDPmannose 4,6-dehydratase
MEKIALVTGCTGMDGSYCMELLLERGYTVHGTIRRSSTISTERIDHIFDKVILHYIEISDSMSVYNVINKVKPTEIYNFCAMSHVKISSELENYTFQTNTIGILNILQSIRSLNLNCKVYQASTSEEFGNVSDGSFMLNESSPKIPVSPYGISKLAAEHICRMYRDAFNMYIVSSTLFNHDSPRRGHNFMTQKIASYVAKRDYTTPLQLGNLNAKRDIGHSKEYVEAIYLMMHQPIPDNYVIATGESHSVREFVELAFAEVGITLYWVGSGLDERGINIVTGDILVQVNERYYRDIDIECLLGDSSKARRVLNWSPKITFKELVSEMVQSKLNQNNELHINPSIQMK